MSFFKSAFSSIKSATTVKPPEDAAIADINKYGSEALKSHLQNYQKAAFQILRKKAVFDKQPKLSEINKDTMIDFIKLNDLFEYTRKELNKAVMSDSNEKISRHSDILQEQNYSIHFMLAPLVKKIKENLTARNASWEKIVSDFRMLDLQMRLASLKNNTVGGRTRRNKKRATRRRRQSRKRMYA